MLAGLEVPAVDEAAHAELSAGNAGYQHSVGNLRGQGQRETFLPLGRFRFPDLLPRLGVERDDMSIERGAEELAIVDRRALVGDTAAHDARCLGLPLDRGLPDLFA